MFFSINANAALEVTIAQGKVEPTPIAITQIFGPDSDTARYGNTIRKIISNNLNNSGLFYTVNEDLYIQSETDWQDMFKVSQSMPIKLQEKLGLDKLSSMAAQEELAHLLEDTKPLAMAENMAFMVWKNALRQRQ
mgnify:CR=1 FL=1